MGYWWALLVSNQRPPSCKGVPVCPGGLSSDALGGPEQGVQSIASCWYTACVPRLMPKGFPDAASSTRMHPARSCALRRARISAAMSFTHVTADRESVHLDVIMADAMRFGPDGRDVEYWTLSNEQRRVDAFIG